MPSCRRQALLQANAGYCELEPSEQAPVNIFFQNTKSLDSLICVTGWQMATSGGASGDSTFLSCVFRRSYCLFIACILLYLIIDHMHAFVGD